MSVIVGGDKIVVHSFMVPVVFNSIQESGKRYVIADGIYTEIPNTLGYKNIIHFRKPHKGGKNEAFKNQAEWEVDGSKGKKYTIKVDGKQWSCTCPAFGWSGNSRTCKHIDKVKTDNGWN